MLESFPHVTANVSAHVRITKRGEVRQDVIEFLTPIIRSGGGRLPPDGRTRLYDCVIMEEHQFADCWIAYDSKTVAFLLFSWAENGRDVYDKTVKSVIELNKIHLGAERSRVIDAVDGPYLAVALMPGMFLAPYEAVDIMGDLERCFAWTVVDMLGL